MSGVFFISLCDLVLYYSTNNQKVTSSIPRSYTYKTSIAVK